MKKIKKIILTLLVMSFLANPMCLILRVHAANEEIAMSRISDTLQSVMQSSEEETIEVMIWLEDINTSQAVLSSTESILSAAKATLSPRALCENPETDAEIYTQYMDARKEAMRECYEEYTFSFVNNYFQSDEICYFSRYAPMVVVKVRPNEIVDIARNNSVSLISYSQYTLADMNGIESEQMIENTEYIICEATDNMPRRYMNPEDGQYYFTMQEVKNYLGINSLRNVASDNLNQLSIGVIDRGYPSSYNSNGNVIQRYNNYDEEVILPHGEAVLQILLSIIPEATYYYSDYDIGCEIDGVYGEIEWLMDNDVQLITCSLPIYGLYDNMTDDHNEYGAVARYFDCLVDNYSVTFVKSSGNYPNLGISSGGTAYNVITVGNYNLGAATIASSSSYYDDDVLAFKPDVCAPGYIQFLNSTMLCGTSFSTPIVAGIAALIISDRNLVIAPETVKAIICASTNEHRYSIEDSYGDINENYRKYGTGIVDCWNIVSILNGNKYYFSTYNANSNIQTYSISINLADDYQYADLVLVYSKHSINGIDYDIADLNLYLYDFDDELIFSSTVDNGNVEVLRNIPTYDEDYTLVIEQVVPATASTGVTSTSFAFAWSYKE